MSQQSKWTHCCHSSRERPTSRQGLENELGVVFDLADLQTGKTLESSLWAADGWHPPAPSHVTVWEAWCVTRRPRAQARCGQQCWIPFLHHRKGHHHNLHFLLGEAVSTVLFPEGEDHYLGDTPSLTNSWSKWPRVANQNQASLYTALCLRLLGGSLLLYFPSFINFNVYCC